MISNTLNLKTNFNESVNLIELLKNMKIAEDFLSSVNSYYLKFLQSKLLTKSQLLKTISITDIDKFFPEKSKFNQVKAIKNSKPIFLVDFKKFKYYDISKFDLKKIKFSISKDCQHLILTYKWPAKQVSIRSRGIGSNYYMVTNIEKIIFSIETNELISYEYDSDSKIIADSFHF